MEQKLTINTQKISIEDAVKFLAVFSGEVEISITGNNPDNNVLNSLMKHKDIQQKILNIELKV